MAESAVCCKEKKSCCFSVKSADGVKWSAVWGRFVFRADKIEDRFVAVAYGGTDGAKRFIHQYVQIFCFGKNVSVYRNFVKVGICQVFSFCNFYSVHENAVSTDEICGVPFCGEAVIFKNLVNSLREHDFKFIRKNAAVKEF